MIHDYYMFLNKINDALRVEKLQAMNSRVHQSDKARGEGIYRPEDTTPTTPLTTPDSKNPQIKKIQGWYELAATLDNTMQVRGLRNYLLDRLTELTGAKYLKWCDSPVKTVSFFENSDEKK